MNEVRAPLAVEAGQLQRLKEMHRPVVHFTLDEQPAHALEGDTVLTAILTQSRALRVNEFSRMPRAGFCVMGACQDCWVKFADGSSKRACQTFIRSGMCIQTRDSLVSKVPTGAAE